MILIAFGANQPSVLGPPAETLREALRLLDAAGVELRAMSRLYASPAWPDPSDPPFANAVFAVETALSPAALLAVLHDVEARLGRQRRALNAPRPIDLDLVDYHGRVQDGPDGPVLPHPRAHERAFVLAPLREIAPDWRHPVSGRSVQTLLEAAEVLGNQAIPAEI